VFPTPYTVQHIPVVGFEVDTMDSDTRVFGEPVARRVYGWRPRETSNIDGRTERVVTQLDLGMPKTIVSLLDRFIIDGALFEVIGQRDATNGWHCWRPGIVVQLKRVVG
jgi:hypothetical protein